MKRRKAKSKKLTTSQKQGFSPKPAMVRLRMETTTASESRSPDSTPGTKLQKVSAAKKAKAPKPKSGIVSFKKKK